MSLDDKDKELRARMKASNIGERYWGLALPQFGDTGAGLRKCITGKTEEGDMKSLAVHREVGTGIFIQGRNEKRMLLFAALAKEFVIAGEKVHLCPMRYLSEGLKLDQSSIPRISACDSLFLNYFQDDEAETPYTPQERGAIEEFLTERIEAKKRLYLNSGKPLMLCTWWSKDFRHLLRDSMWQVDYGA